MSEPMLDYAVGDPLYRESIYHLDVYALISAPPMPLLGGGLGKESTEDRYVDRVPAFMGCAAFIAVDGTAVEPQKEGGW